MSQVIVCAGGTGGHVFPALALCEQIKENGCEPILFTDARGSRFCHQTDIRYQVIPQVSGSKKLLFRSLINALRIFIILTLSWKKSRPSAVIGFGGVMTIVPLLVARLIKVPAIVHEQNFVLGKANRLLARLGCDLTSNFDFKSDKYTQLSTPVRPDVRRHAAAVYEPFRKGRFIISVIGGSQGASVFSKVLPQAISLIGAQERQAIAIIQQAGEDDVSVLREQYKKLGVHAEVLKFIDNVASVIENSSLVICRGGASTLAELSTIGRPAIIVPYPYAADNHQTKNAEFFDNLGAVWLMSEKAFTPRELATKIESFLYSQDQLILAAINMLKSRKLTANTELVSYIMSKVRGEKR